MQDSYRHKGLRRRLIESIKAKGIKDSTVLEAMNKLPRHFFLDKAFEELAYEDKAFPIAANQTISQPFTVAFQSEQLRIKPKMSVMEIGTGSGYQASVLALMGARVYTIERQEDLYHFANNMFKKLNLPQIRTYFRDGYKGLPEFAPFDRIIVTAGAADLPKELIHQLKIGGLMIVPVGEGVQTMTLIKRTSEKEFARKELQEFRFVPFLKGTVGRK